MSEFPPRKIPAPLNGRRFGSSRKLLPAIREAVPLLVAGRPPANRDGDVEMLGRIRALHRFVNAPGDGGLLRWHVVDAGEGEPVVFLHGVPESWYMWHRQISDLATTHRVFAIDLKGFGQSAKTSGDYRPREVAEQLVALFDVLGLSRVNLVTHGLGSVVADYLGAQHPFRVRRYVRGQQNLYHFNDTLGPQQRMFLDPLRSHLLHFPAAVVAMVYAELGHHAVLREDLRRTVREWSHPGVEQAVGRYFHASSPHREWLDRRDHLMANWRFPVFILQGEHDPSQPPEFYVGIEGAMPDAKVEFVDAGHFFVLENPHQATRMIRSFLEA